ncbi:hypothetical protein FNW02_15290 [Komarekiella sp. 'clone 1']|uniref:Uncharacterized protein n=1 Tax=Komarekiella delphini-convector SJRDD-AB1 TaxID=2593771 RepID=A0AA40SY70_9NOST|nr:hypothetical protein [Komarekiella delphini-convector SJRDD-AB1]
MGSHPLAEVADTRSPSVSQTRLALSVGEASRREAMPLAIAQRVADKPLEQKALRCAIRCGEWRGNPLGASLSLWEKTALAPLQKGGIYKAPFLRGLGDLSA